MNRPAVIRLITVLLCSIKGKSLFMSVHALLSILADGEFHSGQELGEQLGISRSAIWKQMRRLEEMGLEVYSVKGRGYRVPGGLDLLTEEQITEPLLPVSRKQLSGIELQLSTASTNLLAMQACQQGDCHGRLYLAEQQTAGRGRRGRSWISPFGRNLYFSLVWRFEQGVAALEGLSLVVGLALVKALQALNVDGVELKWPNDLLYQGKKLAGILLEVNGEASGECQVVIGVGINVAMPVQEGDAIDQPWIDLQQIAAEKLSRNQLMAAVLDQLVIELEQFTALGFQQQREAWQAHNAYQDKEIVLLLGSGDTRGICRGVDANGALLLETEQGVTAFHGGEISIQRS